MLDEQTLSTLLGHLQLLRRPVRLEFDAENESAQRLAEKLTGVHPLLDVRVGSGATLVVGEGEQPGRIVFEGFPGGHEFSSLVLAILHVGGHPPREAGEELAALKSHLDSSRRTLEFVVYYSQSCMNCPDVVQALNTIAVQNPSVHVRAVDGAAAASEVERLGVKAVPAVYLGGEAFHSGRADLAEIATKITQHIGGTSQSGAILDEERSDVLVIGGGPAGAAAAVYAARKGLSVTVAAERFGGQLLDTVGIENLVTSPSTTGHELARSLEENLERNSVRRKRAAAVELLPGRSARWRVSFASGAAAEADAVVLAPGASWRLLGVPGEQEYRNKGVTFCPHCDGPLFAGRDVAVIGGGNSGVEAALDLAGITRHVTVIEYSEQLRADAVLIDALRKKQNVTILTERETVEILGDSRQVTGLRLRDLGSGGTYDLAIDGVFVQIGLLPNTSWLGGTVNLNKRGEIIVDERGRTNLEGVVAAGDATTTPYKQITTAIGSGANAAIAAFEEMLTRAG